MSSILQKAAWLTGTAILALGAWACVATRNPDGSINLRFAPDMVITAWGLEDALNKLTDLLGQCVSGSFPRPCTAGERADILKAIDKTLKKKGTLDHPNQGGGIVV